MIDINSITREYVTKSKSLQGLFASLHRNLIYNKEAFTYCLNRGMTKKTMDNWCIGFDVSPSQLEEIISREGLTGEQLEEFGILRREEDDTYSDLLSRRIIFPIQDIKGMYIGYSARVWEEGDDRPKYLNSNLSALYQKSLVLYGLYQAAYQISRRNLVLVVEGNMDVISCHSNEIPIAVATCGSSFMKEHVLLLKQFATRFIFCFDNDDSGRRSTEKVQKLLEGDKSIRVGYLNIEGAKDLDSFIQEYGSIPIVNKIDEFYDDLVFSKD